MLLNNFFKADFTARDGLNEIKKLINFLFDSDLYFSAVIADIEARKDIVSLIKKLEKDLKSEQTELKSWYYHKYLPLIIIAGGSLINSLKDGLKVKSIFLNIFFTFPLSLVFWMWRQKKLKRIENFSLELLNNKNYYKDQLLNPTQNDKILYKAEFEKLYDKQNLENFIDKEIEDIKGNYFNYLTAFLGNKLEKIENKENPLSYNCFLNFIDICHKSYHTIRQERIKEINLQDEAKLNKSLMEISTICSRKSSLKVYDDQVLYTLNDSSRLKSHYKIFIEKIFNFICIQLKYHTHVIVLPCSYQLKVEDNQLVFFIDSNFDIYESQFGKKNKIEEQLSLKFCLNFQDNSLSMELGKDTEDLFSNNDNTYSKNFFYKVKSTIYECYFFKPRICFANEDKIKEICDLILTYKYAGINYE